MAIDAGFRRRRSRSRRSLPMVVGLPFVALAVSAGCWNAAPAGLAPSAATVAVAHRFDPAASTIAPPYAPDAVPPAPHSADRAPASGTVPSIAPEALPARVPAGLPVPPGRLCPLVAGDRAPPRTA
jgi:hypothetical protein